MKKTIHLFLCLFIITTVCAQNNETTDSISKTWQTSGKFTFLINQSAFSNWQPGGDNSFAGNLSMNYDFNYAKNNWSWDNKIIASYGLTDNDDGVRKSDDRFEFNSIVGKKMTKKYWSFSFFMNFKAQFTDGYDYTSDFIGDNENFPTSGLFKPAYWSWGPGFLWKKSNNFNINIAPLTTKFTFIFREVYEFNGDTLLFDSSNNIEIYGVSPGKSHLLELGLNMRIYHKFDIMKNINMENIVTLFSNYLDKPQNTDLDYTMNLVMKINNVFSTNLTFQAVYDDNAYKGFQVREVFGLGLNYQF